MFRHTILYLSWDWGERRNGSDEQEMSVSLVLARSCGGICLLGVWVSAKVKDGEMCCVHDTCKVHFVAFEVGLRWFFECGQSFGRFVEEGYAVYDSCVCNDGINSTVGAELDCLPKEVDLRLPIRNV